MANKLTKIEDSNKNSIQYNFNISSNLTGITEKINNNTYSTTYGYDKDNRLKETKYGSNSVLLSYDTLARLKDCTINTGEASFKTSYEYEAGAKANSTTEKVSVLDNNGEKIGYSYDKNSNIEVITYNKGEGTENEKKIYYTYNELNELIREDNEVLNKTIKYSYDLGGNILKREEFNYTREVPQTLVKTYEYKYEDTNWKDKLTSFDGKAITYDAIGNPLSDGIYTYTWENGRQLKSITKEGLNISFKYNDSGIRTEKTVNGKTTKYHLVGDKVTFETDGENSIYYTYDGSDNLVSMNLNGIEYYYIRNAQVDITGLLDNTGREVVSYTYDSWGKLISIDGSLKDTLGKINPYLYRGYRYDSETQLYYLQSRYYNPSWERFINADDVDIITIMIEDSIRNPHNSKESLLLMPNLFQYCANNVVNNDDKSGFLLPQWLKTFLINNIRDIADDWRQNTLKNAMGLIAGGLAGGAIGAAAGFKVGTKLANNIIFANKLKRRTILSNALGGMILGIKVGNSTFKSLASTFAVGFGMDKKFDKTWQGKKIDNEITYLGNTMINIINRL